MAGIAVNTITKRGCRSSWRTPADRSPRQQPQDREHQNRHKQCRMAAGEEGLVLQRPGMANTAVDVFVSMLNCTGQRHAGEHLTLGASIPTPAKNPTAPKTFFNFFWGLYSVLTFPPRKKSPPPKAHPPPRKRRPPPPLKKNYN